MKVAVLICVAAVSAFAGAGQTHAAARPNIVYILCDDLGIGDVHAFNPDRGKIATPSIDRLAAEGMMLTDAHTSSSVCTPSRYSILTGRYAWRTRLQSGVLWGKGAPLIAEGRPTVASFLKEQGYATACLGKWHLGLGFADEEYTAPLTDSPIDHGFDYFFGISASLDIPPFAWIENRRFTEVPSVKKTFYREGEAAPGFEAVDVLPTLTDRAVAYVREHAPRDEPYFLYLPYASPHTPIVPTEEWRGRSGLGDYADFVMQTDHSIGQVMEAIDASGEADNTIVIVTSDNGFAPAAGVERHEDNGHFPSAGFRGYKADVWEGGHRVPLVVRWPAVVAAGSRSEQLVGLIDLFATVADVLEQDPPAGAAEDSVSLLPILQGHDEPVRDSTIHHSIDGCFALRDGAWKLARCAGSGGWAQPREKQAAQQGLPPVQLYNLTADIAEQHNLQAERSDVVERMNTKLTEAVRSGRTTPGGPAENDVPVTIDKKPKK
ncbi:Arylsulfatase [Posidoniimonas polymericola]|uniref:Arylsulfatase n=1 Tax=Posidoniimonas polymericola TaxID=2528002 RepID=A0A5C5ZEB5_9BACT|nr:arylsulfatase [Posidoniimonas polymericola]TWT85505.1 Arylsulfatase [Posidoniimonas polymericola]